MTQTSRLDTRSRILQILQWVFGLYFIFVGVMHFIVPAGLPEFMSWMYELSDGLHYIAGIAEILGGLGLILPGLTGVRPQLSPLAAAGLAGVMVGAIVWHAGRGELTQIASNVVLAAAMVYIAYAYWKPSVGAQLGSASQQSRSARHPRPRES